MSKIIYGVAGEGSGHSSRAQEIIKFLIEQGHELEIISYDRGYKNLSKYFPVEEICGLHFDYENNKVRILPTIYKNAVLLPEFQKSFKKVSKIFEEFKPEIVISDFEPLTCLIANLKKIPLISIDNQKLITDTDIKYPAEYNTDALLAKTVTNLLVYNTKANLVISFQKVKPKNKKTFIFPPILRQEILNVKSTRKKDFVLVYVTTPTQELIDVLQAVDQKFVCYGFGKQGQQKNIVFKSPSQDGFLKDLIACKAILANAGFTLMSEALYLKKPYLAWPVAGQFEQILNACSLQKMGCGVHLKNLQAKEIKKFLNNIQKFEIKLAKYKKWDNSKIFKKIQALIKINIPKV